MNEENQISNVNTEKKLGFFRRIGSFLSKNSDIIMKMLIHQFGLTVFGFLLNSAASVSDSDTLVIAFGVFSAVFYLFLLYVVAWEVGAKDKIRIDAGRQKRDIFKGAKMNLVANIPNLLVATLALVGYLCIDKSIVELDAKSGIELFTTPAWAVNLRGISQVIGSFLNGMYLGIGQYFDVISSIWFLYAVCLPSIVVCGFGYYFGTHEKYGVFPSAGNGHQK